MYRGETAPKAPWGNRKRASQDIEIMTDVCKNRIAQLKSFPHVFVLSDHKLFQEHSKLSGAANPIWKGAHGKETLPLTT